MSLYNNYFANSFEELATYYPQFYRNIYEMNEILKAEGKLLDGVENSIERIFSDCFIDTAEADVITVYENILGLKNDFGKSLEERRRLVKAYLVGFGKISASVICEMIKAYTGADVKCELASYGEYGRNQVLYIMAQRGENLLLDLKDVDSLLSQRLPAHIKYDLSVEYVQPMALAFECEFYSTKIPECGRYACGQTLML